MTINVINKKCDPQAAKDKKLPTNSFLIEYEDEGGVLSHDIAISDSKVAVFDHYYDKYKKGLKNIIQTEGRISAKLWNPPRKKKPKAEHPLDPPPAPPTKK